MTTSSPTTAHERSVVVALRRCTTPAAVGAIGGAR